jgi:hypothetical protein
LYIFNVHIIEHGFKACANDHVRVRVRVRFSVSVRVRVRVRVRFSIRVRVRVSVRFLKYMAKEYRNTVLP